MSIWGNDEQANPSGFEWPRFSATQKALAKELETMGYDVEHSGNSGFAIRNSFVVYTKDRKMSLEVFQKINADITEAKKIEQVKIKAFDEYFDLCSSDAGKVYAVVETGYDYYRSRTADDKYETIASEVTAFTQDDRRGIEHTRATLMFHKERMKKDKRRVITLYVRKDMIGHIIGKGGQNIKALQQKYGKRFEVKQDPEQIKSETIRSLREQFYSLLWKEGAAGVLQKMDLSLSDQKLFTEADKEALQSYFRESFASYESYMEEKRAREHQEQLEEIKRSAIESFGEKFIDMQEDEVKEGLNAYLLGNMDSLPVIPTDEEVSALSDDISRRSRYARDERDRKREREFNEISENMHSFIRIIEEDNNRLVTVEELKGYVEERYAGNEVAADVFTKECTALKKREKQASRVAEANKKFDKTANEELDRFLKSDRDTGGHGEAYFGSVGRARREFGYECIAERTLKRLGIYEDMIESKSSYGVHYKREWYHYCGLIQDMTEKGLEERRAACNDDKAENVVYDEAVEVLDEPVEMAPEDKALRKEELRAAKKAYKQQKTSQKLKGGLDALAMLKDRGGLGD